MSRRCSDRVSCTITEGGGGPRTGFGLAVLALLLAACDAQHPPPKPLDDFAVPFVFGRFTLPADNPLTQEAVELGRRLFYDPRLSGTNTVSCSTCHIQALAFTDGKPTSTGVSGTPLAFNSMSLANLLWGPQHFFWNGRAASLEEQALVPIQHPDEMAQDLDELLKELGTDPEYRRLFAIAYGGITPRSIGAAIAAFERTLVSADSRYDRFLRGEISLSEEEELGRKLFIAHPDVKVRLRGANCIDCHSQFLTSGFATRYDGFANNGLDADEALGEGLQAVTGDPAQRGLFKVPSLRNIALTAPYMHDGRFATLEEVVEHYDSGIARSSTLSPLIAEADNRVKGEERDISLHLGEHEKKALVAFLRTLTDERFVHDARFSDPFVREGVRQ